MNTFFVFSAIAFVFFPVFLVGGLIGALLVWIYMDSRMRKWKQETKRMEMEKEKEEEKLSELDGFDEKKQELDEEWKKKIMDKLKEEGSIQNKQVADMLEVSSRTAIRYLSELEAEGRISQTDPAGRDVHYKLTE